MCRIPKVVLVAPEDRGAELRRTLSSLEYEIVAVVQALDETGDITFDVAVLWEPEVSTLASVRQRGAKTVALGGAAGADLQLTKDEAGAFKTRVWELFRPD